MARMLEDKLSGIYHDYRSWTQLASYNVNLARNVGQVRTYQQGGITEIQYSAVIDNRTTLFCLDMDGRVVYVDDVVTHTDKLLAITDPDQLVDFKPFVSTDKKGVHYSGGKQLRLPAKNEPKLNGKVLDKGGAMLPPFHFL